MSETETLFESNGWSVELWHDDMPDDPQDWDQPGKIFTWHRRYNIGDKHSYSTPDEFLAELVEYEYDLDAYPDGEEPPTREEMIEQVEKTGVLLPVYLMDHSGLALSCGSFGCPWDSGQIGWAYINKEETIDEWAEGEWEERAEAYMRARVEELHYYVSGECFGYTVYREGDELDSCGGYLGYKYARREALEALLGEMDERKCETEDAITELKEELG